MLYTSSVSIFSISISILALCVCMLSSDTTTPHMSCPKIALWRQIDGPYSSYISRDLQSWGKF